MTIITLGFTHDNPSCILLIYNAVKLSQHTVY